MNSSNQVPDTSPQVSVPNTKGPQTSVPNTSSKTSVPNTKGSETAAVVEVHKWSPYIRPLDPLRNQRRYSGQTLKIVDIDGRVTIISEPLLDLALVDGRSRILDRAPWTGLPIVVVD
jgi:hypothetical protein